MRGWIVRAAREWPLWIAVAGMLSLLFLPRLIKTGASSVSAEQRELADLRRELKEGDPAAAESRLAAFLARHPAGPLADEARRLVAQATLGRAWAGVFPGVAAFRRAWTTFSQPPRTPELQALRRETASLLAEYGFAREAIDLLRELATETRDPDVALDLVPALVQLADEDPGLRHALLDEASARVSEFRREAPPERRVKGVLAQARLYAASKRDEDVLQLLVTELSETKNPADRGRLQMERGRALARMSREMEAMVCFDEAEKLLADPLERGLAMVHQAQLYARASNPECLEVSNRLTAADSPAAALGLVVAGIFELRSRPGVALDALRNGFARIRRPRLLEEVDFPGAYDAVQAAAVRESDPERLLRFADVFAEIGRLRPAWSRAGFDHAAVLRRARRFEDAANRLLALGTSERAVLEAADACAEGGLHLRAASLYRTWFDLQPGANQEGLFRRAASLKQAGDFEGAKAGFEEYLAKAGPSGKSAGEALLAKAALQKDDEALGTYDRILKARDVATSPARDDWAAALLGRGRALLGLSRPADAWKALREYVERYGEGAAPKPAALEATWLLVRVAVEEQRWDEAMTQLRDLASLAARVPETARAPYAARLAEARFMEGDLQLTLDNPGAAFQAYGEAMRRATDPEDRLRGMIGRARALSRLQRKEEARQDYSNARALFDGDRSFAGRGRDYWEIALDALAKEVR